MGYTVLRDKPEKEAVFLGKDVFVSVSESAMVLTQRGAVLVFYACSSLQVASNSHSEHHFMAVKSICESHEF